MKRIRKGSLLDRIMRRDLLKNKLWAITVILLGYLSISMLEGDATVFIMLLTIGIATFFADENCIG